jgi:hypothetical protein
MKLSHQHAPTPKRLRGCIGGRKRVVSDQHVVDIRRKYEDIELASYNTLAVDFGVNPSTIRHIIQHLGAYQ